MKISMRDKKLLLMLLGILALVLSYFFIFLPQMDHAASLETENETLQSRLNTLLEMEENRAFYEEEIDKMNQEIQDYCVTFPAEIREEDGILLAANMEKNMNMQITNVGLGEKELLSTMNGETTDSGTEEDQTLMEQNAQVTEERMDEIEGNQEKTETKTRDTQEDTNQFLAEGSWNPMLYRNQETFQFTADYAGLKEAVKYLNQQTGRMTIDNISASFDSGTGKLAGTMVVNLFSMENTGTTYNEPDAGNVKLGTDNIFGTLEQHSSTNE